MEPAVSDRPQARPAARRGLLEEISNHAESFHLARCWSKTLAIKIRECHLASHLAAQWSKPGRGKQGFRTRPAFRGEPFAARLLGSAGARAGTGSVAWRN